MCYGRWTVRRGLPPLLIAHLPLKRRTRMRRTGLLLALLLRGYRGNVLLLPLWNSNVWSLFLFSVSFKRGKGFPLALWHFIRGPGKSSTSPWRLLIFVKVFCWLILHNAFWWWCLCYYDGASKVNNDISHTHANPSIVSSLGGVRHH